jgi:hypothetical protein
MELVSSDQRRQKLVNRLTFKDMVKYNDELYAIELENKIIKFDKPIYVGFAVLEVSKTLMYDYHYNVMKKHYKSNIELMYSDTGNIFIFIIIIIIINIQYFFRFSGIPYTNR